MNFISFVKLGFIDVIHIYIVLTTKVLVLIIYYYLTVSIAHVVLVLRVHVTELSSYSFTSDNSTRPCLEPNDEVDVSKIVILI